MKTILGFFCVILLLPGQSLLAQVEQVTLKNVQLLRLVTPTDTSGMDSSGNGQLGIVSKALDYPLSVKVVNNEGLPIAGQPQHC